MKKTIITFMLFVLAFVFITSCKKEDAPTAPQNHLPKIESLTANPATLLVNTETTLTCIAVDEDGDDLILTWSSKRGIFPNGVVGVAVKWVAPSTAGTDTLNVIVNDGKQTVLKKLEITVGATPVTPTLVSPSNNLTDVSLTPTLTWSVVNNTSSYTLQVSKVSTFTSFIYNQSGLLSTNQQISGLSIASTYYWRVNCLNAFGASSWSDTFSFNTVAPPNPPGLLSPKENEIGAQQPLALKWNAIASAKAYTIQVSLSNTFSSNLIDTVINDTKYSLSGLDSYTSYYWRVRASNENGSSAFSNVWKFTTTIFSEMILVEGGNFMMGSISGDVAEKPVHSVTLTSFYIDKYEVTQKEYEKVMGVNPSFTKEPNSPVENVSWFDATTYARNIGKRLPTEAEWEYAARGGRLSKGFIYSGSNNLEDVAWNSKIKLSSLHPIGLKLPNELGIYDMSGNVFEWCSDWYAKYESVDQLNPTGPLNGIYRMMRGGSYEGVPGIDWRVSYRVCYPPDVKGKGFGFRCIKD